MRVLAVDPGGTTGLALYEERPSYHPTDPGLLPAEFYSWQEDDYEGVARRILSNAKPGRLDALVCEGFHIRGNTHKLDAGAFNQTTDLIGACRYAAFLADIPFIRQSPAQAKGFATDDKLRKLGWWSTGSAGHDNDAARHLLTYLAGIRYAPILEQLTKETEA